MSLVDISNLNYIFYKDKGQWSTKNISEKSHENYIKRNALKYKDPWGHMYIDSQSYFYSSGKNKRDENGMGDDIAFGKKELEFEYCRNR